MCSYLHRPKGSVYYARLVVPPRLRSIIGKSDLGRSLKTKELAEAKRLLPGWLAEAQAELERAERMLAQSTGNGPPAPEEEWSLARLQYEEENARYWAAVDAEEEERDAAAEVFEARLQRSAGELSADEAAAARLLREARRQRDDYRDRYVRRKSRDEASVQVGRGGRSLPLEAPACPAATRQSISQMFERYAAQDGIRMTTVKQFRAIIDHLTAFLGHDDALAITLPDLVRWREHLRIEPIKGGKPRSAKTINDSYLAAVNAVFVYGVNQLLIPANPARELGKVKVPKTARLRERDFTKAERKAILSAALSPASGRLTPQRQLARRWVPWLCAYTGARVNEMTQLRKQDVTEIEGVWTIRITPEAGATKTNEARLVPLHPHLIDQGFLGVIESAAEGPLFYDPTVSRGGSDRGQYKKVGMFLAKWVRQDVGITDTAIMPNHAWRHTFKTICLEVEIEERAADYMQGHASKGQGRRYGANTIPALAKQLAKFPRFDLA